MWDPIYRPYLNGTQIDSNASPKSAAGWRAIMISRSKTATWSLPTIALKPGLLPVAPALKLLHKIESDLTPKPAPRLISRDDGLLPNNPPRAFFDELDQLRDLIARLDLVAHGFDCLAGV